MTDGSFLSLTDNHARETAEPVKAGVRFMSDDRFKQARVLDKDVSIGFSRVTLCRFVAASV
jgi:hypothetical protein